MKISPVATGGTPGQNLGSIEVSRPSMKLERARAIARGEVPREEESPREQVAQNVRRLKMNVNRTPGREEVLEAAVEAAQTHVQEESSTPDTTEEPVVEATQPLSPQFAALAKQKRALQLERAQFEKEKAELTANGTKEDAGAIIAKLKSDPLGVLQENGISYDDLTQAILNGQDRHNPEIQALKAEIEALKKGVDQKLVDRDTQAEESALTEMLYEAESLAKEGEEYENIREEDAYDQVLRKIYTTYKSTGRVMDLREAMNEIETKLLEKNLKLASLKKVQGKLAPQPTQELQPQRQMRTLTARDSSPAHMSMKARAIAAMNGTLKR